MKDKKRLTIEVDGWHCLYDGQDEDNKPTTEEIHQLEDPLAALQYIPRIMNVCSTVGYTAPLSGANVSLQNFNWSKEKEWSVVGDYLIEGLCP